MALIAQTSLARATPDILITGVEADASVAVGDWVRIDALEVAQRALADTASNANVFGLVEEKSGTKVTIRVSGVSKALFTGLDPTKEYLLSSTTPGGMNQEGVNVPMASGNCVVVVGKPMTATRFLVRIGPRMVRA